MNGHWLLEELMELAIRCSGVGKRCLPGPDNKVFSRSSVSRHRRGEGFGLETVEAGSRFRGDVGGQKFWPN
jgi:hypothetical protein